MEEISIPHNSVWYKIKRQSWMQKLNVSFDSKLLALTPLPHLCCSSISQLGKMRLLDVGSCFNPFLKFDEFLTVGIDIVPAVEVWVLICSAYFLFTTCFKFLLTQIKCMRFSCLDGPVLALQSKSNTRNDSCRGIGVVVRQSVNEFSRKQNKKRLASCKSRN